MKKLLAGLAAVAAVAIAPGAVGAQDGATVTLLHGIPGATVDVAVDGEVVIPGFEPGATQDLSAFAGQTLANVEVRAAGTEDVVIGPVAEFPVPDSGNWTVVAHLDADGNPMLSLFANDTSPTAPGEARVTVRHTAAAPAVDVRANGDVLIDGLSNPDEASAEVPAATYSADVALAGTEDVVLGPADLNLAEGTHTIVYAWGSASDQNLDLAVQTIDGLHSAPAGVPGGEAGLAPESNGAPVWALGLGLTSVLAMAFAGRQLATARVQR